MKIRFQPYFAPDDGAGTGANQATQQADAPDTDPSDVDRASEADEQVTSAQQADAANQDWSWPQAYSEQNAFNEEVRQVGGDPRDPLPTSGEGETASSQGADSDTQSSIPSERSGAPGEEGAEAEATDDEADADEARADDADAPDSPDDEAGEAAEEKIEGAEEGEPLPSQMQERVASLYPERVIETQEDLEAAIRDDREAAETLDHLDALVAEDDHLARYLELRVQEKLDNRAAAMRAMKELVEAPDPDEDPEAYADWKAERKLQEQRQQERKEREQQLSEAEERAQRQSVKSFKALKQKRDMSDEELDVFRRRVNTLLFGDDRGRVPPHQAEILYRGMHFDELVEERVEKAREEARREGRNEAIEEMQQRKRGDGLPKPRGSKTSLEGLSDAERELAELGQSFEQTGDAAKEDWSWPRN